MGFSGGGSAAAPAAGLLLVDAGDVPVPDATLDAVAADAVLGSLVAAVVVGVGPGRDLDELDMDSLTVVAWVPEDGIIRVKLSARDGFIHGTFAVAYLLIGGV